MRSVSIDTVWKRIKDNESEIFHQIRGKPYTYEIVSDALIPLGINQQIGKSEFNKALPLLPLTNTVSIQHLRGPSYIYSILMDERIRRDDEWGSK